jgi:general secretion pathway protein J
MMRNIKNIRSLNRQVIHAHQSSSGFTLLELIIAITIFTFITLIISEGFRLGLNAWEKGEAEIGETQRIRVISGLISQQLKSAYPFEIEVDDEKVVAFEGDADSLMFVTGLADASFGGFKWVRYSFDDGILLYKEGILPDKEFIDKLTGDEEVIDSEIEEFKLNYYSSDEGEWNETWDFSEELPAAVRVKVSYFQPFVVTLPLSTINKEEDEDGSSFRET